MVNGMRGLSWNGWSGERVVQDGFLGMELRDRVVKECLLGRTVLSWMVALEGRDGKEWLVSWLGG